MTLVREHICIRAVNLSDTRLYTTVFIAVGRGGREVNRVSLSGNVK